MHLQLFLSIALVLALLAGCFAGLFWRLASGLDARSCSAEWLEGFSLESYAPMKRLLDQRDVDFLAAQPGYHPEIARRLMAERHKIFTEYLRHLAADFNQLIGIGKLMIVYSAEDRQEFARRLFGLQVLFYMEFCAVRLQLVLIPLGWTAADVHPVMAALSALRDQVLLISGPNRGAGGQRKVGLRVLATDGF